MGKSDYETAERLLTLIDEARNGVKHTVAVVKRKFGVEKATASRYLQFARKYAGLRTRSRGGRKIYETASEAEDGFSRAAALELALLSMHWLRDTPYHSRLAELAREARANVEAEALDELERLVHSFYFKRREPSNERDHADVTQRLIDAIRERRVCEMTYQKLSGEVGPYVFEPWSLMLIGEASYVLARERNRRGVRTFDLSSIKALTVLDEQFPPPSRDESDPARLLGPSVGSYAANYDELQDVVLQVRPPADVLVRRRSLHSSQTLDPQSADGWATMRLRVVPCPELIGEILSMLPNVRVVRPDDLREAVRKAAIGAAGSEADPGIRE